MCDTGVTATSSLTADPDLRFTPSGAAAPRLTLDTTRRVLDSCTGRRADSETLFICYVTWRDLAENAGESLSKGVRALTRGRLRQREYETSAGEGRQFVELEVDECGPSLRVCHSLGEPVLTEPFHPEFGMEF